MSHESFWDFSLRLYRLPQVSETCLTLQNTHGFDVNVLLFACWYGRTQGALPTPLLQDVLQFSAQWRQEVVSPLRHARTWMKGSLADPDSVLANQSGARDLRERIKAVELRSEQLQQQVLEQLAQDHIAANTSADPELLVEAATTDAVAHNLDAIREASAVTLTPALAALLKTLQETTHSA